MSDALNYLVKARPDAVGHQEHNEYNHKTQ